MNQSKWLSDFVYDREATPLLWSFDELDPEKDNLMNIEDESFDSSSKDVEIFEKKPLNVQDEGHLNLQDSKYTQIVYQESERIHLLSQKNSFPKYLTIECSDDDDYRDCRENLSTTTENRNIMSAYENPVFEEDEYSAKTFNKDYGELRSGTKSLSDPGTLDNQDFFGEIVFSSSEGNYSKNESFKKKLECPLTEDVTSATMNKWRQCYNPFHDANSKCECMDSPQEGELIWDAYLPPLELRWSDVMIKQIFDLVEHDNENYVQRIRKMVKKKDYQPFNILQRLCWYDDETHTVQSLVGVFEYDM